MHAHPFFDLILLDDEEITTLTGSPVASRETVHEWPLSCVQRARLESGAVVFVKSQAPPTVEPEFYRQVHHPAILRPTAVPVEGRPDLLLFAECVLPLASAQPPDAFVDRVLDTLRSLPPQSPVFENLGSVEAWRAFWQGALADLHQLVGDGRFPSVRVDQVHRLERYLDDFAFLRVFRGEIGFTHGDLLRENVLADENDLIILDWQRPLWGPVALDRAVLTESLGGDPFRVVEPAVLILRTLRLVQWYTAAAVRWFPPGVGFFDRIVAEKLEGLQGMTP